MVVVLEGGAELIYPRCAKCRKPVDSLDEVRDPLATTTTFVIRCHGAEEEKSVPQERMNPFVDLGDAFEEPAA